MTEKKMIRVSIEEESPGCWPEDIDKIIERLTELKSRVELKPGERLDLEYNAYFCYPYDQHTSPMFILYHTRLENDAEFADRTAREHMQQQERNARERAEFQRLSAKFKSTD